MTTPQHPTDTLHYAHTATTPTGDLAELRVLAVTFDVDGYARVHADALIPLVKAAGYARIDSLDELPPSLRSVAPEPRPCARCDRPGPHKHPEPLPCSVCGRPGLHWHDASRPDDYVDQGDEPHDDQPDDHIDPWAHPKHEPRCTSRSAHGLGSCVDVAGHEGPHTWQQPHPLSLG